jgi:tRNA 2-selenouridine synthase
VVLDGNTGSAKTEILQILAARGCQVIDLEGLANHRGSLFGAMPGGQPSQKAFEGRLALALATLDPDRPVLVEAESSKVGDCIVPKQLWAAMCAAPRIRIAAPLSARAAYLARAYGDISSDAGRLTTVIGRLRPAHSAEVIDTWLSLAEAGEFQALSADLMRAHYDPRYEKHRTRFEGPRDRVVEAASLSPDALEVVADAVQSEQGTII